MGQLADALRANLRELAQADARMLRELDAALPAADLDALSVKQLKQRCKQKGLKGYSSLSKPQLIARIRAEGRGAGGDPARPLPGPKPAIPIPPAVAPSRELAAVVARLDQLETLMMRIAEHLGVT